MKLQLGAEPDQFSPDQLMSSETTVQIARCYRDEQSRIDRQFEFTQLDVELSFTDTDSVMKLIEGVILESWPKELV